MNHGATMEVLEELLSSPAGLHVLVLGAYRDNEVGDEHPLHGTFSRLEAAAVNAALIDLATFGDAVRTVIEPVEPG